ncbi:MAG: RtcB family protein [Bacteroidales bacterium]|nr:RtcB family protein [Bacteroidales bacterium]
MKKLKLRAREINRLGFTDSDLVSFIIHHVHPHFITAEKQKVLKILKELQNDPDQYREDPVFGVIAGKLQAGGKQGASGKFPGEATREDRVIHIRKLEKQGQACEIYGRELIEKQALEQMETAMMLPITLQGALMADAHSGYGLPIGGVLATQNAVIPYGVGMDIGCRMCLTVYNLPPVFIENNKQKLKKILLDHTRFGRDEFPGKKEHEIFERKEFKEIPLLRDMKDKAYHQLGTSGHGNHFVDIGIVRAFTDSRETGLQKGEYFGILSHSGSRHFGASIAHHYTRIAKDQCRLPKSAVNLAWLDLDTEEGLEYWMAMNLAGDYSAANHQVIHFKLSAALSEKPFATIENHHNFAWKERLADGTVVIVHRKGATPATTSSFGIIPGSMTTPAFIIKGKGNPESLNSASHGAGRMMSRSEARRRFTDKTLGEMLDKAGVELIGGGTDEAPGAYKDICKIMEYQKDLVETIGIFEPKIVRMSKD